MNIPSLEFYVESIRHLTSSVAVRRQEICELECYLKRVLESLDTSQDKDLVYQGIKYFKERLKDTRTKQKHEKRMLAYFVAQQRDILDYYKATEELYEGTL